MAGRPNWTGPVERREAAEGSGRRRRERDTRRSIDQANESPGESKYESFGSLGRIPSRKEGASVDVKSIETPFLLAQAKKNQDRQVFMGRESPEANE